MTDLIHDVRQTFRLLRRRPVFTAAIILSIALGVGANTAIFSVANMLLIRPLPFPEHERLVRVQSYVHKPGKEPQRVSLSEFNVAALREQGTVFEGIAAWFYGSYNLIGGDEPAQVYGARSTANALAVMGVEPALGRYITPEEDQPGNRARVVVLSHALWQSHFGSDPQILGHTVKLNDETYSVIGVMPEFYEFPYKAKLWVPLGLDPAGSLRMSHSLHVMARLKQGVTREQATEELGLIASRLAQEYPDTHRNWSFGLVSLRYDMTRDLYPKRVVFMLMSGAGFLLLIACANVANMLLSRGLEQSSEVAIRAALGISSLRLIRQLITQGVVIALLGGALGLLLAFWLIQPLVALHPSEDLNRIFMEIQVDHRVMGFAFLISVAVGVLFSLVPALKMSRPDLQSLLTEGSRTTPSRRGRFAVKLVVIGEVAVAVMLLVGGGLMLKSLFRLQNLDAGFNTENLLVFRITPSELQYPDQPQQVAYLKELRERIAAVPGVEAVATNSLYAHRTMVILDRALPEGWPEDDQEAALMTNDRVVSPGLVKAMGLRLVKGRDFTEHDREDTEPVVIVSESLAKNAWPGEDPLDRRIKMLTSSGTQFPWMRVVGVVGDVIDNGEVANTWYLPQTQVPPVTDFLDILVRTDGDPIQLLPAIRRAVWSVEEEQAISNVMTAHEMVAGEYWQQRTSTFLLGMFAAVGLLLTIVGIYGIQSYSVLQQTHEMGVRMVFGARPKDIVWTTLRQGMLLSVIGLAGGLAGALLLTRFLRSLLFEVSPTDGATFAIISVVALTVALIANYLPARRATKVDPVAIIRY